MSAPTFTNIQTYVQGLIGASSALSALGGAVLSNPFLDQESSRSQVAAQVRQYGVCIEVGFPWIGAPESKLDGSTQIEAMLEVFIGESPTITHSPSLLALINEVVLAVTVKSTLSPGQKPARLRSAETVKTEDGYILSMMSFYVPMNIKPSSSVSSPQV